MHLNPPQTIPSPQSVEKLSSMKLWYLVPKRLGTTLRGWFQGRVNSDRSGPF